MNRLVSTLVWIVVGLVGGASLGVVIGLCFGWFTAGCTPTGNDVGSGAAFFGAILGGVIGALGGAFCEVRNAPFDRVFPWAAAATVLGGGLLVAWRGGYAFHSGMVQTRTYLSLRSIGFALQDYQDQHGTFPPAALAPDDLPPERRLSWYVAILPFFSDHASLYRSLDLGRPWDDDVNRPAAATRVDYFYGYRFPPTHGPGEPVPAGFVGIAGVGPDAATLPVDHPRAGVFGYDRRTRLKDIKDGTSQTMMVSTCADAGPWIAGGPATLRCVDPAQRPYIGPGRPFGGPRKVEAENFATILMADGSIRIVSSRIKPEVFEALATIAGGEQIDPNDF
jgi:hypothetical protein